jgi:predicted nucleic acid-binding protein
MKTVFADAYFYIALLNQRDAAHGQARAVLGEFDGRIVTSQWVLLEVADAFCRPQDRPRFERLLAMLSADNRVVIIEATGEAFDRSIALYLSRSDKSWPLTDCLSFIIMQDAGLTEAFTADQHFEQAGFVALLREA